MRRTDALVLLNAGAGNVDDVDGLGVELRRRLRDAGLSADVRRVLPSALSQTALEAAAGGAGMVIAAGGDGTASAAASALAGTSTALAVLPLGTRNHLARDLAMPMDIGAAVAAIAAGTTRSIDLGSVNGRVFVNNVSLGLYPRSLLEAGDGGGRLRVRVRGVARSLRRLPCERVSLRLPGHRLVLRSAFVLVANNAYCWSPRRYGRRERLDDGRLWLYFPARSGPIGFGAALWPFPPQRPGRHGGLVSVPTRAALIDTRREHIIAAIDGEPTALNCPLRFAVRPAALRVVTTQQEEQRCAA